MKIHFNTDLVELKEVQERMKEDGDSYAVLRIEPKDTFNTFALKNKAKAKKKQITLLCFIPSLYEELKIEERLKFEGFVSFGYGNTFLVVERVINEQGIMNDGIPF